jgi:hypothetical protein
LIDADNARRDHPIIISGVALNAATDISNVAGMEVRCHQCIEQLLIRLAFANLLSRQCTGVGNRPRKVLAADAAHNKTVTVCGASL